MKRMFGRKLFETSAGKFTVILIAVLLIVTFVTRFNNVLQQSSLVTPDPFANIIESEYPVVTIENSIVYNLRSTVLQSAAVLYVGSNNTKPVIPYRIPSGETVYIMGKNNTGNYLRVV